MKGYLKKETLERTVELLRRYMQERHGMELPAGTLDEVRQTMMTVSQEAQQGKIANDLESLNRRVLSILIPWVLARRPGRPELRSTSELRSGGELRSTSELRMPVGELRSTSELRMPVGELRSTSELRMLGEPDGRLRESLNAPYDAPEPRIETEPEPVDKDLLFMQRLKELEMTRSMPVAKLASSASASADTGSPKATPGATPATPVKSTMDLLLPAMNPVNLPSHIATVFMPAPPKRGTELWIQSRQRNWIQSPDRNGFAWSGPIPPGTDLTQTRVQQVFLPEAIHRGIKSPYLVLQLEGAGGQTAQVFLMAGTDTGTGWRAYAPASAELGYLKPLATPWTVKLLSASGKRIELGRDGWDGCNDDAKRSAERNDAEKNEDERSADEWWMFGTNGSIYIRTGDTWDEGAPPVGVACVGLNFSKQWWVLLNV